MAQEGLLSSPTPSTGHFAAKFDNGTIAYSMSA
eukprot:CAMPEP_0181326912 /NCGR_PEP_ID=MMETSP1101-20121128/21783_1 /TAXON_ID=46948 /ORGANISM="Rhodomonas abbreviata, Strain Caron Lab Isolate" /LENGTH=32 /DNA_ID= /DNA_START= /DNA_END= /DNA_ORIENTATION=